MIQNLSLLSAGAGSMVYGFPLCWILRAEPGVPDSRSGLCTSTDEDDAEAPEDFLIRPKKVDWVGGGSRYTSCMCGAAHFANPNSSAEAYTLHGM